MSAHLEFTAKPGCEDQINAAYAAMRDDAKEWIVYSEAVINAEIAFIHSPEGANYQSHLRGSLRSVDDWNVCFPMHTCGTGHLRLVDSRGVDADRLRADVQFILEHRMLFAKVEGLDTAAALGLCTPKHVAVKAPAKKIARRKAA